MIKQLKDKLQTHEAKWKVLRIFIVKSILYNIIYQWQDTLKATTMEAT
jgi:hypothetical protein